MTEAEELYTRLDRDARASGYSLNPVREDTMMLVEGLLTNIKRYGYPSCPCRIAEGKREEDLDIICPCDYRDADLSEYGACYCALYVTEEWVRGGIERRVVPERRPPKEARARPQPPGGGRAPPGTVGAGQGGAPAGGAGERGEMGSGLTVRYPVWRCRVCGYLCARDRPPNVCPICKAGADRFERFV
ncbi:MAG: ferredoxin-thioredoxin reductase catalytic domain-containing protein [Thermoplasmatota archaeon]